MSVSVTPLTAPTITLNGSLIDSAGAVAAAANVTPGNKIQGEHTNSVTQVAPSVFYGDVTVTMTAPYTMKDYATPTADTNNFAVGELNEAVLAAYREQAEIRYTLNGKDPSRTKFTRYSAAFDLTRNQSGTDNVVLKARTYRRGEWSNVVTVELHIVNGSTDPS